MNEDLGSPSRTCFVRERWINLGRRYCDCWDWRIEKLEASEIFPRRLNAKEVLITQQDGEFVFLVADGSAKLSGRDYEFQGPTLRREFTVRRESLSGESQGDREEFSEEDAEARKEFGSFQGYFIYCHHIEPRVQLTCQEKNCHVSQVGRGGGQGQSLFSLAICLRGNFGPSVKWAASAPSKGWGRTHIANSSRPGSFKRPGAGVAIRAPATQTLPPVAGEGKLPTAIPIIQPWSRCHRDEWKGGVHKCACTCLDSLWPGTGTKGCAQSSNWRSAPGCGLFKPLIAEGCGPRLLCRPWKGFNTQRRSQLFSGQGCSRLWPLSGSKVATLKTFEKCECRRSERRPRSWTTSERGIRRFFIPGWKR